MENYNSLPRPTTIKSAVKVISRLTAGIKKVNHPCTNSAALNQLKLIAPESWYKYKKSKYEMFTSLIEKVFSRLAVEYATMDKMREIVNHEPIDKDQKSLF